MTNRILRLATVGEIAALLGIPVHRIECVLRSRPHIRPKVTAEDARCFDDEALVRIRRELNSMNVRRQGVRNGK